MLPTPAGQKASTVWVGGVRGAWFRPGGRGSRGSDTGKHSWAQEDDGPEQRRGNEKQVAQQQRPATKGKIGGEHAQRLEGREHAGRYRDDDENTHRGKADAGGERKGGNADAQVRGLSRPHGKKQGDRRGNDRRNPGIDEIERRSVDHERRQSGQEQEAAIGRDEDDVGSETLHAVILGFEGRYSSAIATAAARP